MLSLRGSLNSLAATIRGLWFSPGFPRYAVDIQVEAASGETFPATAMVATPVAGVRFVAIGVAAAGESMTVDVFDAEAGTSLLDAPFVYDDTKQENTVYNIPLKDDAAMAAGATFEVVRTYVAGGGPNAPVTTVEIAYYGDPQP